MLVAMAVITCAILMTMTLFVFNSYFSSYTSENMQVIASYTASRISEEYARSSSLQSLNYNAIMESLAMDEDTAVMVLDKDGETIFTSASIKKAAENAENDSSVNPNAATKVAIAQIKLGSNDLGSVRIWAYGSDALMSKPDIEFRDNTVEALVLAALLSILLATGIGFLFSRSFVAPIKKITDAANEISSGNLSARTGLTGNNEIGRLGSQFDQMADSIESDRRMELRLTSDVAHELRTPLMAVQATVEAMIDGVYDADVEHLALVDSEVRRLSRLVDALLRLSRLERRSEPMHEAVNDLGELVNTIVESHKVFVNDSGLEIDLHVKGTVKAVCDRDLIRQAVANLISNAVRYTPKGGRIDIYVEDRMTDDGKMATIAVKDTGIGLSEDEIKMVFSRFWRADSGRSEHSEGLGIGLTVVNEIIQRHEGKITVEGEPNKGSTFTIFLPGYDEERSRREAREALRSFENAQARKSKSSNND